VGADIPGLRNVVQHGVTGLLSEKENVEGLAENISALIRDSQLRQRLGKNAADFARRYLWENQTEQQLRFYQTIVENQRFR
jgi:glycosyltransferase involved in cell wall biosynthesis